MTLGVLKTAVEQWIHDPAVVITMSFFPGAAMMSQVGGCGGRCPLLSMPLLLGSSIIVITENAGHLECSIGLFTSSYCMLLGLLNWMAVFHSISSMPARPIVPVCCAEKYAGVSLHMMGSESNG
jgi:hypothetical protein